LRAFENKVVRRIFVPKAEKVAGGWRRLHNEELQNLYASQNIIRVITSRKMRWTRHIALIEKMRNAYRIFFGKPEGNKPLGRTRHKW
jgi:hypothetical protein